MFYAHCVYNEDEIIVRAPYLYINTEKIAGLDIYLQIATN
jgi:hypothetical protein